MAERRGFSRPRPVFYAAMVLLVPTVVFAVGEAALRFSTHGGLTAGRVLYPRSWAEESRAVREAGENAFDPELGYVWGHVRHKRPHLYMFGPASDRVSDPLAPLRDVLPSKRILVFGDSFTMGAEVTDGQSWPRQLERRLGPEWSVMNFGLGGYGLDQAVLRFEREARRWPARMAILGVYSVDFRRTGFVYRILDTPGDTHAKPRFVLRDGRLKTLNVPLTHPKVLFAAASPEDLPFIEYDLGYRPKEWRRTWYSWSYLLKWFLGRPEKRSRRDSQAELYDEVDEINRRLLRRFIEGARAAGMEPVIVLLPGFRNRREGVLEDLWASNFMRESGVPFIDVKPALEALPARKRASPGGHYSPEGNAAVAEFLARELPI